MSVKIESRTVNTKRNILTGLIKQVITILLPFVIRTIILYSLGPEFAGLNGLFSSILQVLNLADLGFTGAVTFILYKPIALNDEKTICSIMLFLKRVYRIIGIVILCIGLVITPFLSSLISGTSPDGVNIHILFLVYLANTVVSYFLFSYKSALFTAMQRVDVVNNIYSITNILIKSFQILLLLVYKNYYVYIVVMPLGTIANNLLLQVFSKKYYSWVVPKGRIPDELYRTVIKQVKALFIGKVGTVARNSLDDIILSSFFGLVIVAIYDNYYYVFSALYGFLLVITQSMQASVGNSLAIESKEKNYKDLQIFTFVFMWIISWCSVCLFCLYQHFMLLWMRSNYSLLLSNTNMTLLCVYFYILNMNNTRNLQDYQVRKVYRYSHL